MSMKRGHGGRPSKGPRDQFTARPALPVGEAVRARAAELGYELSDFVTLLLAREVGMEEYAPAPKHGPAQGVLLERGAARLAKSA